MRPEAKERCRKISGVVLEPFADLPFRKGDLIEIKRATQDPNWYDARRVSDGKTGIIPINYVQQRRGLHIHEMPWFFGKISRDEAEKLLKPRTVGLFLVRESTNYPGDYTLCVVSPSSQMKVEHYRITSKDNNKYSVDDETYFSTLSELVKHYKKDADGLCTTLVKSLKKEDNAISSTAFKESFQKEGWSVATEDITFKEKIGTGEFGEVFKGDYQGRAVAIKQLKDDTHAAQSFLREASVMTTLQHQNLVVLIGISFRGQDILILTEHCSKGSLVNYLRSRGRAVIKQEEQLSFARDVCTGMEYLEEKHMIHRDLAARNVLLTDNPGSSCLLAKVSDFGLAKDQQIQQKDAEKFPVKWTAPEAIREKKFSSKSDVWSFGILLWEIFSFGRNPYPRVSLDNVLDKVLSGYRMEKPDACPPHIYQIMLKCWCTEPDKRPSFREMSPKLYRETNL
ncbi:tyrosine-protein kinase CSK-like isoform X2 [Clytia hemisphaerica]|uniref:tyrosine-protein kinase CSK-like isoform X2 n=1 Tax=Clytia hemisphaerica TaxID=252671 RepID=UPI0034D56DD0